MNTLTILSHRVNRVISFILHTFFKKYAYAKLSHHKALWNMGVIQLMGNKMSYLNQKINQEYTKSKKLKYTLVCFVIFMGNELEKK